MLDVLSVVVRPHCYPIPTLSLLARASLPLLVVPLRLMEGLMADVGDPSFRRVPHLDEDYNT